MQNKNKNKPRKKIVGCATSRGCRKETTEVPIKSNKRNLLGQAANNMSKNPTTIERE